MNTKTSLLGLAVLLAASTKAELPVTTNVAFDFDASMLALSVGDSVTEWTSSLGPVKKATAPTAQATQFEHVCPFFTIDNGRPAVVFGQDASGETAFTLMDLSVGNTVGIKNVKTVFVVSRPFDATPAGAQGVYGDIVKAGCAFSRTAKVACSWGGAPVYSSVWVNGSEGQTFGDCGGTERPHLVAARTDVFDNPDGKDWAKILGGAYVLKSSDSTRRSDSYFRGAIHEVVGYTDKLTDEQILEVQRYLMTKWGLGIHVWTGDGQPENWEDPANWQGGFLPDEHAKEISLEGATVAYNGRLSFVGSLDLKGGTLACAGLAGGTVTNSTAAAGSVKINAFADARLDARVTGNVNVVKYGTGELRVAAGQAYAGATELHGGTLKAELPALDLAKFGKAISFHLDASATESLETDASANVTKWSSLTANGVNFRSAAERYDSGYPFKKGYTQKVTDGNGLPCVRFGAQLDEDDPIGSFLCSYVNDTAESVNAMTVFLVNRQNVGLRGNGAILGNALTSADRIMRLGDKECDCRWGGGGIYDAWVSGKQQEVYPTATDNTVIEFKTSSGTEGPHILTVVRMKFQQPRNVAMDCLGAAYLQKDAATPTNPKVACGQFDLYEVIAFEEQLTDAEILEITTHLAKKWNVKTRDDVTLDYPANTLSPSTTYSVLGDATLDFAWMVQPFGDLSFSAAVDRFPHLTVKNMAAALSLTGSTLTLVNETGEGVYRSDILSSDKGLDGEFSSVIGGAVQYVGAGAARFVRVAGTRGFTILVR